MFFSIIISAHSIRCYKAIASKYDGDPDNFFTHEKYFVPENLVTCEQGVTHCTMIHGNGKISMTTLAQHNMYNKALRYAASRCADLADEGFELGSKKLEIHEFLSKALQIC